MPFDPLYSRQVGLSKIDKSKEIKSMLRLGIFPPNVHAEPKWYAVLL